jgi:hypothetical protein
VAHQELALTQDQFSPLGQPGHPGVRVSSGHSPIATKRIALDDQTEREQELVSALNELNLAIRMLDQHVLTDSQRDTMQHLHLNRMRTVAARVIDKYKL